MMHIQGSVGHRRVLAGWAVAGLVFLSACGGGGGSAPATPPSASCDLASQQSWLRAYMQSAYLWTGLSPNPEPTGFGTLQSYFSALLFTGNASLPADQWSYLADSVAYTQFFGEGKSLGFGISVNGLEGQLPLKVRYVEALSPAAQQGIVRGEVILAINGRSAADLLAAGDFSALSPTREGDAISLQLDNGSGPRTVTLNATLHLLTPVPVWRVFTQPSGTKVGYVVLKDFITQAEEPLLAAFAALRAAGATELILDLRYNGGGRLSTANLLASQMAGVVNDGKVFARLSYNAAQSGRNVSYALAATLRGFDRAVVLTGQRTCSASELLVNGLKPHLPVLTVGDTTCGKPFGFNPVESCSTVFSAVNFEVFNAVGEGRYVNGLAPTCAVADTFSGALGDANETLTASALSVLQTGTCPVAPLAERSRAQGWRGRLRQGVTEPGMPPGLIAE
jgi:carboxyl-terminal processing protease